jgi:hypothetical protein
MKNGATLEQVVQNLAQSNPQVAQILPMIQGKSGQEIINTARQMYRTAGQDYVAAELAVRQHLGV